MSRKRSSTHQGSQTPRTNQQVNIAGTSWSWNLLAAKHWNDRHGKSVSKDKGSRIQLHTRPFIYTNRNEHLIHCLKPRRSGLFIVSALDSEPFATFIMHFMLHRPSAVVWSRYLGARKLSEFHTFHSPTWESNLVHDLVWQKPDCYSLAWSSILLQNHPWICSTKLQFYRFDRFVTVSENGWKWAYVIHRNSKDYHQLFSTKVQFCLVNFLDCSCIFHVYVNLLDGN